MKIVSGLLLLAGLLAFSFPSASLAQLGNAPYLCMPDASACGFPDVENTGVKPGIAYGRTADSSSWRTCQAGEKSRIMPSRGTPVVTRTRVASAVHAKRYGKDSA